MTNKKNKHNRSNKPNNNTSYSSSKIEINEQQLLKQCLQMHELLKDRTAKLRKMQTGQFCFILSTKWLQDWKDYVGYEQTVGTQEKEYKNKLYGKRMPGKINTDIVAAGHQCRQFYALPEKMKGYQYLSQIIAEKRDKDVDYIAVTTDIWMGFLQYYEAEEIRRPVRKLKGSVFYDSQPLRCDTIIVNLDDDELQQKIKKTPKKLYNTIFSSEKMMLPTIWNYKEMQDFFKEYCKCRYETDCKVRIWKGYGYAATNPIVQSLVESIKQKKYQVKGRLLTEERYRDFDIDEYIKNTHTLIIEIGQALKPQKQEEKIFGYCEQCIKKTNLSLSCMCQQVVYCSNRCRIDDQTYHYKTCEQAFDSEDDKQYEEKIVKEVPKAGLDNLGNTCYMNSVLQTVFSLEHFRKFFGENQFLKHLNQNELKENNCMLLRKFSKTIKQITQEERSYLAWPLKGQVDYNLAPFKGYKQHDANDFLINFFNVLNDYLSKTGDKAYNKVLQPFIGDFHSKVICPLCQVKSQNNEIFMQLSLPIKSKTKAQTYSYNVVQYFDKITRGRANLQDSWVAMKKHVNVPEEALVWISKEPQGLTLVDENETTPEKALKGLKGELVYFKNMAPNDDYLFVVSLVTTKQICGSKMKSSYGSPAIIAINDITTTLGTLWLRLIRMFFYRQKQIVEEAIKTEEEYYKEIEAAVKRDNQAKQKEEKTEATKENEKEGQEEQKESQECKKIVEQFNERLKSFAKKIGIQVYLNHYKKSRNICGFCNKKCNGCDLPIIFDKGFQDFFQNKYQDFRFEVFLRTQASVDYSQQDFSSSGDATIHDCLTLFNEPQQLDQQNAWYCSNCDNMALALKQLQVKVYPPVLIIHLNRFKNFEGKKLKNSDPVIYNQLEHFGKKQYRLMGVVIHEGSMDAGHYWAICYRDGQYYVFNDTKVAAVEKVYNKNAYILVYCSTDFKM